MTGVDAATAALAGCPGVGLDELDATASLQTRVDRKYVLPLAATADLFAALARSARVLEIDGARDFRYASTYFDTPDLASFRGAAYRRRRRFKVRTRSYVDTGACFLEVKTRAPRGVTVKHRCEHDDADSLAGGHAYVADELAAARVPGIEPARLEPVLRTRYRRTTLLLPDARVTVDTGLVWERPGAGPGQAALGDLAIIETKTGSAPSSADHLLWRAQHRPDRFSKYATGMALLDASLPDAPWRRTLRRTRPHLEGTHR